jgi:hypothetical protein
VAPKNKRDRLKNSGMSLDAPLDNAPTDMSNIEDFDNAVFGGSEGLVPQKDKHTLFDQLPAQGFRKALQAAGGTIQRKNFTLNMNGLTYDGDQLTLEEWREMGEWLTRLRDAIQWMIGDWANLGAAHMENWLTEEDRALIDMNAVDDDGIPMGKYLWLANVVDYKYGTLRNFAYIANQFPVSRRRDALTYSHHVEVAKLDTALQERLLDWAETGKDGKRVSVRNLRTAVQSENVLPAGGIITNRRPPIYQSVSQLHQSITKLDPTDWQQLSRDDRRQLHHDLKAILAQIERLGID